MSLDDPRRRLLRRLPTAALLAAGAIAATAVPAAGPVWAAPRATAPHTAVRDTAARDTAAPLQDAQARATALRLAVDRLRTQAEQATEAFDEADSQLGQLVTEHLSAQRALDDASSAAGRKDRAADQRVRALYTSGGAPALYATVLQGTDISDVLSRLQSVRAVVGGDRTAKAAAGRSVTRRRAAETRLAGVSGRQIRLQAAAAVHGDEVRSLLARTDALLAGADAQVRALAERQRAEQEQARAREALAVLDRAQRLAARTLAAAQRAAAAASGRAAAAAARSALAGLSAAASGAGLPAAAGPPPGVTLPAVAGVPAARGGAVATALATALAQVGKPYIWGGTGPVGFDCSGLTQAAYRSAGIALPRTSRQQWYAGPHVPLGELAAGDLLFWASDLSRPASIHHEALYLGNGQMVAAPHTGALVRVQPLYLNGYMGAVRPTA